MKMTETEKRLFRERVIHDYKVKHEKLKHDRSPVHQLSKTLRKLMPLNIFVGLVCSVILVYVAGVKVLFQLLLTGMIWITIISTLAGALMKK